ncbi:MAG: glycosyltransferase [Propionibacteriaceae bacterium]|nr:glycosyltransferase [Propionibacteriaceae bacterium]
MSRRPPLAVFTPWYPSLGNPMLGNFVGEWSRLAADGRDVRIINAVEWPGGPDELVTQHKPAFESLVHRMARAGGLDARGAFGTITRVPNVLVAGWQVPRRAETAVDAIAAALGPIDAPVVHGHVGYFGGLAAARLARPDARVIVTEHSSELGNVLADDAGRALYAEVLQRAHRLTCVSGVVKQLILQHLPEFESTIEVLPNPVDFDAAPRRAEKPESLDKWLFVGGLTDIKGVVRLVEAFIEFARTRPAATLGMFGEGNLRDQVVTMVTDARLGERVTLHGAVPRSTVLARMPEFDVLVAPSRYETFHLAVPEAVAAGLPVLLTRSGGPEESLGQTHRLCAEFVDVNDDAEELVAGLHALEARLPDLDPGQARAELNARFGPNAVRSRLAELYGEDEWGPLPAVLPAPMQATRVRPEKLVVFARRTWRSLAVEPQIAVAKEEGVEITTIGVPQPKAPAKPLTVSQRALRKGRRLLSQVLPSTPTAAGGATAALLGDLTSAADASLYWDANPGIVVVPELDPTLFGRRAVDAS